MAKWQLLDKADYKRFAEIMRLMDERYVALSTEELARWIDRKKLANRNPKIFGWFEKGHEGVDAIRHVMAMTSVVEATGHRSEIGLPMLGIAADVIPQSACSTADIETWLGRFLLCVKDLIGLNSEFRAIRPKTMTFKPMERMHDLMRGGIEFESDDSSEGKLYAGVFKEKDIGHSFYWNMKIVPAAKRDMLKLVVIGKEMSSAAR